jgi:osmotically-inducible protein OsmY
LEIRRWGAPGVCLFLLVALAMTVAPAALAEDRELAQRVRNVLRADLRVRADRVTVSTTGGWVTLEGQVTSYMNKHQAERVAARVADVRGVTNRIEVAPSLQRDERIASDVLEQLRHNAFLQSGQFTVAVHDGVVTLTGHVDNWSQADEADATAAQVLGVRAVRNNLLHGDGRLRSDDDIQRDVRSAFRRDALLADLDIDVRASQGVVTLAGVVPSLYHRDRAEQETRLAASVVKVDNQLQVLPQAILEHVVGRLNDQEIAHFVRQELDQDPRVGGQGILLDVTVGKVVLRGEVPSLFEKQMAERIARRVVGVQQVENHLQVAGDSRDDETICCELTAALSSDAVLQGQQVQVVVRDGRVTLRGEVEDFTSKAQAARLAGRVRGVRAVDNETKVSAAARLSDDAVTQLVADRLRANAIVREFADRIQVRTAGGVVTLSGEVPTAALRTEAARAALLTDGVLSVDNQLRVLDR